MATLTALESGQVDAANSSGRTPVVFIHGLWLLASSWDRWAALFGRWNWWMPARLERVLRVAPALASD